MSSQNLMSQPMSHHGEKLWEVTHRMRFNAFHDQLTPSSRHVAAAGLIHMHRYCAHALHSGRDDGINTLPMCLAVQHFQGGGTCISTAWA